MKNKTKKKTHTKKPREKMTFNKPKQKAVPQSGGVGASEGCEEENERVRSSVRRFLEWKWERIRT